MDFNQGAMAPPPAGLWPAGTTARNVVMQDLTPRRASYGVPSVISRARLAAAVRVSTPSFA
jgi:hypothetical protein